MTSWKLGLVALLGLSALTLPPESLAAQLRAQQGKVVPFNISPGTLLDALTAFQDQAGTPPTGVGVAVMGKQTAGVSGELPPREALERLLSGTGLTFLERDDGGFMIEPLANVRVPGGRCVLDRRKAKCREE
jgi:hypothetical protein